MSDQRDVGRMLEAAERAAAADDLTSADELLTDIARIQEAELGPQHPDLAKTLNNLAVVAEKTGRVDDAERFYRRAVAIATASLPVDHPMVAASRENLRDFCRARGLPIDPPEPTTPAARHTAAEPDTNSPNTSAELDTHVPTPERHQEPPRKLSYSLAKAAIGVAVILVAVAFLMRRPWLSPDTSAPATAAETALPQGAEPAVQSDAGAAIPAPIKQGQPTTIAPRTDDRSVPTARQPTTSSSSSAITLITAQLCGTFSTSQASWRCDPASDPVSPGPLVLYTRVRSPADAVVVHRWYRGDTLRQSGKLTIRANPTDGYRTYSRHSVDAGEWRVEVRSADGGLLHEQRFVVR